MTPNQWPSIQPQRPADWADELAAAIIADVHSRRYTEAESLIAARLRLVKCEGERDGINRASAIVAGARS